MGQVTLYLEDETLAEVRAAAAAAGLSMSAWLARLIRERSRDVWPEEVLQLAGAWPDAPLVDAIRASDVPDLPREEW
jgi:hypothetical protein